MANYKRQLIDFNQEAIDELRKTWDNGNLIDANWLAEVIEHWYNKGALDQVGEE